MKTKLIIIAAGIGLLIVSCAKEGMPLDAIARPNRQQAELALAREFARVVAVAGARNAGPFEQRQRYVVDLHGRPPASDYG